MLTDKSAKIKRFDPTPRVRTLVHQLAIDPPKGAIDVAAGAMVTLFDDQVDQFPVEYVHLQNVGTGKIKYAINSDCTSGNYHEVLSAGVANEDGLGASVEFNNFEIRKLTVFAEAGAASKVAVVIGRNPGRTNTADLA